MQLSRNWIADFVNPPADVEELARKLTDAGHAVELVEEAGDDRILDVDITTNRPDCMNHFGMAREVAVLTGQELRPLAFELREAAESAADAVAIEIESPQLCRRYVGRVVRGVTVGPSPDWLVGRLESIGLRAINNVVDVTNYVLWELGQPLHGFDLNLLAEHKVVVRLAREGETLVTLDGEKRELDPSVLVIADAREPIALAGVMGGLDSEVTESTRDVLIESAWFDSGSVRRTARSLGMHTDASHRFERGTDIEACAAAADRAAALIAELGGGEVLAGRVDPYPRPLAPMAVSLDMDRARAFAGTELSDAAARRWLEGLGCQIEIVDDGWSVTPPTWRQGDLELTADLYEELVRIHGFAGIEATLPAVSGADGDTSPSYLRARTIRAQLAASGFTEVINFAFHDAESDQRLPGLYADSKALELANPLSELYAVLRRSLLPNLLESARFNQRRGAEEVRLFEVGHVFAEGEGGEPVEMEAVALVGGGRLGTPWEGPRDLDFFDLKGAVEALGQRMGVAFTARAKDLPAMVSGCSAELLNGDRIVGYCGRLEEDEGTYPLFVAELTTDVFTGHELDLGVELPSKFPGVAADLTFTHSVETSWAEIETAIREWAPEDLISVALKDRYSGKGVPDGAVNTTIAFHYSSPDHSLTQESVNERQSGLAARLNERFAQEIQG